MKTRLLSGGGMQLPHFLAMVLTLLVLLLPSQAKADDEAWAEYNSNTTTLTFKYGEKPTSFSEGVTAYALKTAEDLDDSDMSSYLPGWNEHMSDVTNVVFDSSFANYQPTCCFWFMGMGNLTSIKGMEYLNTSKVTNMMAMFNSCCSLTELDLSHFDTSNVTNMTSMFKGCLKLNNLDLSHFDTSKVTEMTLMFYGCSGLAGLNLSSFNTSSVTNMADMFNLCEKLTCLDLTSFNTENVTDMSNMFSGSKSLTSLDLSSFNTAKVTNMKSMFSSCSALATIYVSNKFSVSSGADSDKMFDGCTALKGSEGAVSYDASKVDATMASYKTGYFTAKPEAWAEFNSTDGTLTFKYGVKPNSFDDNVTAYAMNVETGVSNIPSYPYWYKCSIKKVVFEESFANARPTTCSNWFSGQENLAEIQGLKYLNTEKVTNMADMFMSCVSLTNLDLSGFNTENVTDMSDMFLYCTNLKSINLKGFNTANVENMSSMFRECESLGSIDVSGFNTEKVYNMGDMFSECYLLTTLDLSGFNTEEVAYMDGMFADCKALTSVDLSSFNTENVSLMRSMFNGCEALTTLDISSFNTENASDMYYFFTDCSSLKTIYVSDKFSKKTTFTDMFTNCTSLEGAVKFDSNKTSSEMANYKTGYFKTYYKIGDDLTELYGETLSVDKLNLTDGKDFVARAPFTAGAASYSRSMSSTSHWATLCLPYAVDASNVEDCQLYELKNVSSDLITLTQLEGTVAAGTPVLAYFNSINKSSLDVDASNVNVVTAPVDGTTADGYQLVGSFTETEVPDNGYIISKNKFWLTSNLKDKASATAVKTKGLRAWLKYSPKDEDEDEYDEAKAHVLGFAFDDEDETSAIEAVDALTEGKAEIYDIQGHRTDRLQKGLNIVKMGGATKKIMVK